MPPLGQRGNVYRSIGSKPEGKLFRIMLQYAFRQALRDSTVHTMILKSSQSGQWV
jgi:hypothetical protein